MDSSISIFMVHHRRSLNQLYYLLYYINIDWFIVSIFYHFTSIDAFIPLQLIVAIYMESNHSLGDIRTLVVARCPSYSRLTDVSYIISVQLILLLLVFRMP
jgi:hypothetical protein